MTRGQANFLLLLSGAIWGMGFVAQSEAMAAIGPLLFIGLRFVMATLVTLPFAWREGARAGQALDGRVWLSFLFVGVLLFAGMVAQQYGLLTTTVTHSGFLTGLYVVMAPLAGVLLFRQWPHPVVWLAAVCALFGIWLLSGGAVGGFATGDWLTILCAAIWSLQIIFMGRLATSSGRPVALAVTQFAFCALFGLGLALLFEPFRLHDIWKAMPEIVYSGVFSGGLAFTLQAVAQRYTSAPQAAIFLSSEAVFAALFGMIFLGEGLPAKGLIGCAFILAAMLATEIVPALYPRSVVKQS